MLLLLAAACRTEKPRADSVSPSAAAPTKPQTPAEWRVSPRGLGPLQAGMTQREAEAILGAPLSIPGDSAWRSCGYIPSARLPAGVRVMVENGTIARVEIDSSNVATVDGARVGDTEDQIRKLYGASVAVTPHKYTDGHYLTVTPPTAADSAFRIVFETLNRRVTTYRAGRLPAVQYVEGCA